MAGTGNYPISISTTITSADLAKLDARARLQGLSHAQALRSLVEALPEPCADQSSGGRPS
jgi:hypothetical protein